MLVNQLMRAILTPRQYALVSRRAPFWGGRHTAPGAGAPLPLPPRPRRPLPPPAKARNAADARRVAIDTRRWRAPHNSTPPPAPPSANDSPTPRREPLRPSSTRAAASPPPPQTWLYAWPYPVHMAACVSQLKAQLESGAPGIFADALA
jgi:hypothetical protein